MLSVAKHPVIQSRMGIARPTTLPRVEDKSRNTILPQPNRQLR
jgi:hypothetical protein